MFQGTDSSGEPPLALNFIHERYVVVEKPSGVAVHRTRGSSGKPLLQRLRDQLNQHVYPVHRLDRGTSGALVMALDVEAQRTLGQLFEHGLVNKSYLAVVRGWPAETLEINHPLRRLDDDAVALSDGSRQDAHSTLSRLATIEHPIALDQFATTRYALVRVEPKEGRRHQVRRHLKHISHPIIGDTTYGKGLHNRLFRDHFGASRLLLHAHTLAFFDPFNGLQRHFTLNLPDDFSVPLAACGLGLPMMDRP